MSATIPERRCDVVMKGGITSGVVYPLAIVELSREFRFKNIGGTSAGAIAAALTAAAEYQRVTTGGGRAGFDKLGGLPDFLGGKTGGEPNLLNLFPPTKSTRRLFAVAAAFLGGGSMLVKVLRAWIALVALSPLVAFLALLLALLPITLLSSAPGLKGLVALALIELMAVVFGVLLLVLAGLGTAARKLPAHGFGFSTGMAPHDRKLPGVTEWLHATIQEIAGRAPGSAPLTFGDLWAAEATPDQRAATAMLCEEGSAPRAIDLLMITTGLTHGRPYRLPFDNRRFSFKEAEFREYFPDDVVDHLLAAAQASPPSADGTMPLPPARELPLVVAARLSLSFPLLFAMVPLYAVDYTFKKNWTPTPTSERCWFIDGGLSSNFPVNLFDSPLPRWPTFCIDLADFHPDYPKDEHDESKNVWMVSGNGDGRSDRWLRFPTHGLAALGGYVSAMLDTIRNWRDNTQLTVPGYRDRIVHVKLSADEGGLNLDMSQEKVASLSQRGHFAGVQLRERFGVAGVAREGLNWNTHRWTRYLSSMSLLQKALRQCDAAVHFEDAAYPSYGDLIARTKNVDPHTGYWWAHGPATYQDLTKRLLALADEFARSPASFEPEAPRPTPELRITPRL